MHGLGPHILAAFRAIDDRYEPDDDLRALRRVAAEAKATARKPRRPWRFRRELAHGVSHATAHKQDTTTTTA